LKGPKHPLGSLGSAPRFNFMTRGILLEHGENNKQTGCRQIRDQDVGLQGTPIFVGKAQPSYRAADLDSVVRTTVVRVVTVKDVGYVTDDALCTWIVLAGARRPLARLRDMYLTRRVHVSQEHSRHDRDRIFQVVDVRDVQVGIDIVCKCLVANTWKTIEDSLERRSGREVKREVNRVKKRERSTEGVADQRHRIGFILGHGCLDRRKNV
jgi:hypothetical protein